MAIDSQVLQLVMSWEELQQKGESISPEELCKEYPQLLPEVRRRIGAVQKLQPMVGITVEDAASTPTPESEQIPADPPQAPELTLTGLRYRLLRFHAKGGLGEVFVAQDEVLNRPVALKRMQARHAGNASSRRRFLREAEVTGRLQHPGVVPVHSLLHDSDGQLCYTMRFVEGETLADAVKRFYATDGPGRDPGERNLALRQLLGHFVAVCKTIAYAHNRGILHRDIKPANIMIGTYGETMVVDWGLAKPFEPDEAAPASCERTLAPTSPEGDSNTRTGDALGTPAYMSPEQAAGRWDMVGPATDIYGLGATLYAILTGEAPFASGKGLDTVQGGKFPLPRERRRGVPAALEAVCLKAMALRPEDRYGTVLELAADLEHWLADEPVSVYHERLPTRLGRWTRLHRSFVTSVVAAGGVAALGLVVATLLLASAYRETEQQRDQARTQRDKAQERLQLARSAVEEMLTQVGRKRLENVPEIEPVRQALLQKALTFCQKFLQEESADPIVRQETAWAYQNVGDINQMLGRYDDAKKAYLQAVHLQTDLVKEFPQDPKYRSSLSISYEHLGQLHFEAGKLDEALAALRISLRILEQLACEQPDVILYQDNLASNHNNMGNIYLHTGQLDRAEAAYRKAMQIWEPLVHVHLAEDRYQHKLAGSHNNLGYLYQLMGRPNAAESARKEAIYILAPLARQHAAISDFQRLLGVSHQGLGWLYWETDRPTESVAAYQEALKWREPLARQHPAVISYQQELAESYSGLGLALVSNKQTTEGKAFYQKALDILEPMSRTHPSFRQCQETLARTYWGLGWLYQNAGPLALAEATYQKALPIWEQLARDHPNVTDYPASLAHVHHEMGILYRKTEQLHKAEESYQNALVLREQLVRQHPEMPKHQLGLAWTWNNLSYIYKATERQEQAEASYQKVVSLREQLARAHPEDRRFTAELGESYGLYGDLVRANLKLQTALDLYDRAIHTLEGLPENRDKWRLARARTLARLHDHARATAEADDLAQGESRTASDYYGLACVYALAHAAVSKETTLPQAQYDKLAERYAARAVELLKKAQSAGYFKEAANVDCLKKDNDYDSLRSRDDLKKLFLELEGQPAPVPF